MLWTWLVVSCSGGLLAALIVALMQQRKARQVVAQPPTPQKVEIEIKLPIALYPSWSAAFPIELEEPDLEMAAQLDELAHRLEQKERNTSSIDQRRMEYVRHLVQTGRLNEDL